MSGGDLRRGVRSLVARWACLCWATQAFAQLSVISTAPMDGTTAVSTSPRITVVFTHPLDAGAHFITAGSFVNDGLSPREAVLQGPMRSLSIDGKALFLEITLKAGSRVQYTVLGARSVTGEMLEPPYTLAFTTADSLPKGSISGTLTCPERSPVGSFVALMKGDPFDGRTLLDIARSGRFYLCADKATCAAVAQRGDGLFAVKYVPAGTWYPIAVRDLNGDGELSLFDDAWGMVDANFDLKPDSLVLGDGEVRRGLDLVLRPWLVPQTAREAISSQSGLARTWAGDAAPFYLVSRAAESTGRAWEWQAQFHSADRDSHRSVVSVGRLCGYESGPPHGDLFQSLPQGWVDSPAVMDSAWAALERLLLTPVSIDSVRMELGWSSRHLPLPYARPEHLWGLHLEPLWRVHCYGEGGMFREVLIEPFAGQVVRVFSRCTLSAQEALAAAQEAASTALGGTPVLSYAGGSVGEDGCAWQWRFRFSATAGSRVDVAVTPYGVREDTLRVEGLRQWQLPQYWIDSKQAVEAARAAGGEEFLGHVSGGRISAELLWLDPLSPLEPVTELVLTPAPAPPEELLARWALEVAPRAPLAAELGAAWRVLFAGNDSREFLVVLVDPATGNVMHRFPSGPRTALEALAPAQTRAQNWGPRTGLAAVLSWSEDVDSSGACAAWAYVFSRPGPDSGLVLVSADGMVVAELQVFASPSVAHLPLPWMDSREALRAAEHAGGRSFRERYPGATCTAVLGRGWLAALPGRAAWVVTYTAPGQSESLEIVLDAANGELLLDVPRQSQVPMPTSCALYPAFPNPCSAEASIRFALPAPAPVLVQVYDLSGRLVWSWRHHGLAAGEHSVRWPARSPSGSPLPSGLYLVRLQAGSQEGWQKVLLCR
ncbi:MAG: T9SS type A sorting domain-containing protein [candidate division KSB1 bacterium]|nr:T9SS type A sorting domain-containing protein [candidate division KSB1 bacterium]